MRQDYMDLSETKPYTSIPYFNGYNNHIDNRLECKSASSNIQDWFDDDFSFVVWIKPNWVKEENYDRLDKLFRTMCCYFTKLMLKLRQGATQRLSHIFSTFVASVRSILELTRFCFKKIQLSTAKTLQSGFRILCQKIVEKSIKIQ